MHLKHTRFFLVSFVYLFLWGVFVFVVVAFCFCLFFVVLICLGVGFCFFVVFFCCCCFVWGLVFVLFWFFFGGGVFVFCLQTWPVFLNNKSQTEHTPEPKAVWVFSYQHLDADQTPDVHLSDQTPDVHLSDQTPDVHLSFVWPASDSPLTAAVLSFLLSSYECQTNYYTTC